MNHQTCDLCGQALGGSDQVRFEMTVEIKAAYDPLQITDETLATDFKKEIARILRQLEGLSAQDAEDQVYRTFTFDLCPGCQRKVIDNFRQGLAEPKV